MKKVKVLFKVLFLVIVCLPAGCSLLLVPGKGKEPDLNKVKVGASRSVVENELDKPISEVRASIHSGADKKCLYHFFSRQVPLDAEDRSFVNNFTDVKRKELIIFYNRMGRVVKIQRPGPRNKKLIY